MTHKTKMSIILKRSTARLIFNPQPHPYGKKKTNDNRYRSITMNRLILEIDDIRITSRTWVIRLTYS